MVAGFLEMAEGSSLSLMDRTMLDHFLDVLCLLEDRRKHIEEQICALSKEEPYRDRVRRLVVLR